MPELPEVETIKEQLKTRLINKQIVSVDVFWPKTIVDIPIIDFQDNLKSQIFIDVKRRGKWLIFELNDYYLLTHLRMEGKFFFKDQEEALSKHEHVVFKFDDMQLRFHDTRKFGRMYLLDKDDLYNKKPLNNLGLEPFDESLDTKYLKDKYKHKSIPIKTTLLDQGIVVGIGNIYADEILFLSSINPYKKARELNNKELQAIIDNTKIVLNKAIQAGGTTIRSYVSIDHQPGLFQNELMVHDNAKKPCKKCGTIIVKEFINKRGTYYCPSCQKDK